MFNRFNNNEKQYSLPESITNFMCKVYGWMGLALALTAATAYGIYQYTPLFEAIMFNEFIVITLFVAQILLVITLSIFSKRMSFGVAATMFLFYAILSGITLSVIFAIYQLPSLVTILAVTIATFIVMSLYGYYTKTDLTSMGNIFLMALLGIIIAGVVNLFLHNTFIHFLCAVLGVIIFTGLMAYDTQKIKELWHTLTEKGEPTNKIALLSALILYLDVVNLFLKLLQLFGKKKK
ncbi:MAG: Bax inhibitor-1/YccA family protein [bacterium]